MKNGFTLIELLVVVLIIGVLTAVAVPSYRVHVARSRIAQYITFMQALNLSQARYYNSSNTYASDLNNIDIALTNEFKLCSDYSTGYTIFKAYHNNKYQVLLGKDSWGAGWLTGTGTCESAKEKDIAIFATAPGSDNGPSGGLMNCPATMTAPCMYCIGRSDLGKKACSGVGSYLGKWTASQDAYSIGG